MRLPDRVRAACAEIIAGAHHVAIDPDAVEPYARTLPSASSEPAEPPADLEAAAALSLTLNAINFGSGWFPTLRKRPGMSGFRTVEAAVREHGPWSSYALAAMEPATVAEILGQDPAHELMALYAAALRELGEHVRDDHSGSFLHLANTGLRSAAGLAAWLAAWPGWQDPGFYKRAQIAAFDLHRQGIVAMRDVDRLTAFADNLVPHVLRLDGVLVVDPEVVARVEREELLEPGSRAEVELRAGAVHAVELLVAAHGATFPAAVDEELWNRGAAPRYKAVPRHRSRTTAY